MLPPIYDDGSKPPFSYATLIGMAILRAPARRLTLAQIYKWINDTFAWYRNSDSGWQNSIRHNLSLNKAFSKQERPKDDPGKGNYWIIEPGCEYMFVKGRPRKPFGQAANGTAFVAPPRALSPAPRPAERPAGAFGQFSTADVFSDAAPARPAPSSATTDDDAAYTSDDSDDAHARRTTRATRSAPRRALDPPSPEPAPKRLRPAHRSPSEPSPAATPGLEPHRSQPREPPRDSFATPLRPASRHFSASFSSVSLSFAASSSPASLAPPTPFDNAPTLPLPPYSAEKPYLIGLDALQALPASPPRLDPFLQQPPPQPHQLQQRAQLQRARGEPRSDELDASVLQTPQPRVLAAYSPNTSLRNHRAMVRLLTSPTAAIADGDGASDSPSRRMLIHTERYSTLSSPRQYGRPVYALSAAQSPQRGLGGLIDMISEEQEYIIEEEYDEISRACFGSPDKRAARMREAHFDYFRSLSSSSSSSGLVEVVDDAAGADAAPEPRARDGRDKDDVGGSVADVFGVDVCQVVRRAMMIDRQARLGRAMDADTDADDA
ncbi:uncharacterized protein V1510DRAFT_405650 [Dipodascopsis tothii]|uniref:uncharacterized protein n=1 Tax=Dipodascopsis tothii TaxID=44089 RepID=UPI0034CEEFAE